MEGEGEREGRGTGGDWGRNCSVRRFKFRVRAKARREMQMFNYCARKFVATTIAKPNKWRLCWGDRVGRGIAIVARGTA